FGGLTVGVNTRSIDKNLTDAGGNMRIDYAMEINNSIAGESALCMDIREAAPEIVN
ncbi:MAG: DUF1934 family protein, partial [Oscillospiraceae bacterium]|nr:DUF1934 family protein [Oscillospiraceae bacterium]